MRRVMIIGQPGGGKSTLARNIGARLGLPVVHIDLIHWMPGWQERPKPEKIRLMRIEEDKDTWVIEGGLSATFDTRMARCDTLIVLNMPFALRVWRVFKRTLTLHGRTRPDLPENCPERFDRDFWQWIWDTRTRNRLRNLDRAEEARQLGKDVHVLSSPREVRDFLAQLDQGLERAAVSGQ